MRGGGAKRSLGRGKVSERFGVAGGSLSGALEGGANPPYPFFALGIFPLPRPLLTFEVEVPGRSFASIGPPSPAAEGRRGGSNGLTGVFRVLLLLFIRSNRFGPCLFGGTGNAGSSSPLLSSSPPYPPGLVDCGGGGELFAICGEKNSSALAVPGRPFGVCGDMLLCDPLEPLMGVSASWGWPVNARSTPLLASKKDESRHPGLCVLAADVST